MAEYNNQRFYWIKLTDRFMTSDTVDFLMEQKDGANYVVLYQMLCLKTVNNDGQLSRTIGEVIIPYEEEKIQRDMKWFSIDTIRVALNLYQKLGLIYRQENGTLKIANYENLIGSQTISAFKKQEQLKNRGGKLGGQKVEFFPPDKEKDIISSSTIKSREYEIKEKESYLNNNSQYEESKFVNNKGVLLKGENTEVEQTDDNEPLSAETLKDDLDTFCSRFGIMIDNYNYRISQMDFKALTERFEESEWLKANVTSFKKICDIYPRIISGYYKDYNRKPKGSREFDILQRMLKEAEEEEEREKQEKGESDNGPQESS